MAPLLIPGGRPDTLATHPLLQATRAAPGALDASCSGRGGGSPSAVLHAGQSGAVPALHNSRVAYIFRVRRRGRHRGVSGGYFPFIHPFTVASVRERGSYCASPSPADADNRLLRQPTSYGATPEKKKD